MSFVLLSHFPTIEVHHFDLGMTITSRLRVSWPRTQTRVLFVMRMMPSSHLIGCEHQHPELRHPCIMHSHATFNRKRLQNRICSCDAHLFVRLCQVHVVFPTLPVLFIIFPLPFFDPPSMFIHPLLIDNGHLYRFFRWDVSFANSAIDRELCEDEQGNLTCAPLLRRVLLGLIN